MERQERINAICAPNSHQWTRVHSLIRQYEEDSGCALHAITTDDTPDDTPVVAIEVPHQRPATITPIMTYGDARRLDDHDLSRLIIAEVAWSDGDDNA